MTVLFSRPIYSNDGYCVWKLPQSVFSSITGFVLNEDSIFELTLSGSLWFSLTYATPECSVLRGKTL